MALSYYGMGAHHLTASETWFDFPVPPVSIDRDLLAKVLVTRTRQLTEAAGTELKTERRALWLGGAPSFRTMSEYDGREASVEFVLHQQQGDITFPVPGRWAPWLMDLLTRAQPSVEGPITVPAADPMLWEIAGTPVWWGLRHYGLILTDAAVVPKTEAAPIPKHDPVFAIVAR